ncbi:MAG TPA: glycoside hydrolase family 30 protein, partial [Anditalea sp.]|nr:glycoside hydrolase family 30 protein [Anditalea sp.]
SIQDDADENQYHLKVDPQTVYQEIDHFGASDAWSGQFVGTWPEPKKGAIADLLFSNRLDEQGNPVGIGLSLWRFNLGAGSTEQGEESGIRDAWRRAPSLVDASGNFKIQNQKGQIWLAQAAKERGVKHLLTFLNSPPVFLTRNNKAYTSNSDQSNLAPENYEAFAEYMVKSIEGMHQNGLQVDYISPVNEPQWDWNDGGQEGTPFWNQEIAGIVKALDAKLEQKGLQTKIDIAEAGQIEYLYSEHNRPGRSNQIQDFFDPESDNYIGNLSHMSQNISGHSYFTTSPFQQAVIKRQQLAQAHQNYDIKYWMSEYCILGDNDGEIRGNGKDLGINPALYMARVIHNDLAVAQASAWHWWIAISPYDYKDGLVYITKSESDGEFEESKMLWALGNYSRFVRPNFQRIDVSLNRESNQDFLATAFKNPVTDELVVVIVNSSNSATEINVESTIQNESLTWHGYVTDKDHNLAFMALDTNTEITIPARSIVTLTTQKP